MEHSDFISCLRDAQTSWSDLRDNIREAHDFVNKRDGQWEREIIRRFKGKPRYTDDRVNPIINQIVGSLSNTDFAVKVEPAGGEATQDTAKVYNGLIRTIRNISKEGQITAQVCRNVVEGGLDGYLIEHDYSNDTSFDQDLLVRPIHDFVDRVWLDPNDLSQDGSDSKKGFILEYMTRDQVEKEFGVKSPKSIGSGTWHQRYYYKKKNLLTIARVFYLKEEEVTLVQMSDGSVYEDDDDLSKVIDDLAEQGITQTGVRKRTISRCYVRYADANGWLDDEQETIFRCIPIVPVYSYFKIVEGKVTCRGAIEKLMDIQRVHNYAFSRDVEEVALSPRKKYWMTREQAEGEEKDLQSLNTNMKPVQFYNHIPNVPPPTYMGGGEVNGAVRTLVDSTDQGINSAAGMFGANMGDIQHLQSGAAIERQIDRGDNGTSAFFEAMEVAITRVGQILVQHIPYVYDATRQVRILKEDRSYEMVILNQVEVDAATGESVTLNDLTVGQYDVTCDVGPAYRNRQEQASETLLRAIEKSPDLMGMAGDILMKNINAPGFDLLAERLRAQALQSGVIPMEQMTDEERQWAQEQASKPQQPSAEELALQVQMMEAQTAQMAEQNKGVEHQIKMQELQAKFQQEQQKTQSKLAVDSAKIQQTQQKIDLSAQQQEFAQMMEQMKLQMQMMQTQSQELASATQALKNIKDAIGAEAILSPEAMRAYQKTARDISSQ